MNSLDFFFYTLLPRQRNAPLDTFDGSKSITVLIMSFWMWMLTSGIFLSFSIFYRNHLADLYVNTPWPSFILGGMIYGLIILRYCFFISYKSLFTRRQKIKYIWIYHIVNWLIVLGAPVLLFVTFRLYLYRYV